jgi:hypothetical protein
MTTELPNCPDPEELFEAIKNASRAFAEKMNTQTLVALDQAAGSWIRDNAKAISPLDARDNLQVFAETYESIHDMPGGEDTVNPSVNFSLLTDMAYDICEVVCTATGDECSALFEAIDGAGKAFQSLLEGLSPVDNDWDDVADWGDYVLFKSLHDVVLKLKGRV